MNTQRTMTVSSPAFADGARMPAEHVMPAAGGRNTSVPLAWSGQPEGTQSFAIEVFDLHPIAHRWVHWLVVDIPADVTHLPAGASGPSMPEGARELVNGFGTRGWGGPQPPPGSGSHDYRITVYALDAPTVDVPDGASLDQFRSAIDRHSLAVSSMVGTFQR